MAYKWFGVLLAAVCVACGTVAVTGVVARRVRRLDAKLDLAIEAISGRFDELDRQVGDRNNGFVEGYLLGSGPEATVVPLTPRDRNRR